MVVLINGKSQEFGSLSLLTVKKVEEKKKEAPKEEVKVVEKKIVVSALDASKAGKSWGDF